MDQRMVSTVDFDQVLKNRMDQMQEVLGMKASEYAPDNFDRMYNFNVAARILNCTPEQALLGMYMKHLVSVLDLIKYTAHDPRKLTRALINEKIGDSINYHVLLEAMLLQCLRDFECEVR